MKASLKTQPFWVIIYPCSFFSADQSCSFFSLDRSMFFLVCWSIHALSFLLINPCCFFSANQSMFFLFCWSIHALSFLLINPCFSFSADQSMLFLFCWSILVLSFLMKTPCSLKKTIKFYMTVAEIEVTEIILAKVSRLCQLLSYSRGILSRL